MAMRALLACAVLAWAGTAFGAIEFTITGGTPQAVSFSGTFELADTAFDDGIAQTDELIAWAINVVSPMDWLPSRTFDTFNSSAGIEWSIIDDRPFHIGFSDSPLHFVATIRRNFHSEINYFSDNDHRHYTDLDLPESIQIQQVDPVPEPAALAVWGILAAIGFIVWRRRK